MIIAAQSFSVRLQACLKKGNLRVADLAKLFNRSHSTVNGWVQRELNPSGGPTDVEAAYTMLGKIESYIQRSDRLPVPAGLSPLNRIKFIRKLRQEILTGKRL